MDFHPASTPPIPPEPSRDDVSFYRGVLHELIEMGADLARMIHRQASAEGAVPAVEQVVAFERVSRTIRRSILLAQRLDAPAPGAGRDHQVARRRIIRAVEDAIQRHAEGDAAESLEAELVERLDRPELDEEIEDRPVAEIIADICRDLGLAAAPGTHPWKRRSPADIAALCARAAGMQPGRAVQGACGPWPGGAVFPAVRLESEAGCRGP